MFTLQKFIKAFTFASCLFILVLNFSYFSIAGTWKDDFNDGNLNGWTHPADQVKDKTWSSVWKSENGVLDVTIHVEPHPPDRRDLCSINDFLQLTAFPISSSKLTVEVTIVGGVQWTSSFGIALGIHPEGGPDIGQFYVFTRDRAFPSYLVPSGVVNPLGREDLHRDYPTIPFGQPMKITFESGRFRLFSQDTLLLQFVDEGYPKWAKELLNVQRIEKIELVGIYAKGFDDVGDFHGVMDDFMISGPNLAVNARRKLATTWGNMKNESTRF
ncbi:MAG: hypothetical protein DRJ47_08815 [Thermoprotei archaeon]|nr:MAG: hypothetical protein DRJ47_08815 [Thermoprotei archaeon]